MLTADDTPTIRNVIQKRLSKETGIDAVHMTFAKFPGSHIAVCIELQVGSAGDMLYTVESRFDLPDPFEHAHLLNEIDQVAEHAKEARGRFASGDVGLMTGVSGTLPGTGRRGLWKQYGLRVLGV